MELKAFMQSVKVSLDIRLNEVSDTAGALLCEKEKVAIIRSSTEEVRSYMQQYKFNNIEEEILYHKELLPPIYGCLLYHFKRMEYERKKIIATAEKMQEYISREIKDIYIFLEKHEDFYNEYVLKESSRDEQMYTRNGWPHNLVNELSLMVGLDSCPGFIWLTQILAYLELKKFWDDRLAEYQNSGRNGVHLKWSRSKTDWTELMYALYLDGSFNDGNLPINVLARALAEPMGINYVSDQELYGNFAQIKRRKTKPIKYIQELGASLIKRLDDTD